MHQWKRQCEVEVHVKRKSNVLEYLHFSTPVCTLKCNELDLASDRRISRWLRITERRVFPVQLICGLPAFLDIDLPQIPLSYFSPRSMRWALLPSLQEKFQKLVFVWLVTRSTEWVSINSRLTWPRFESWWRIVALIVVTWICCQRWKSSDRANHRKFIALMFFPIKTFGFNYVSVLAITCKVCAV